MARRIANFFLLTSQNEVTASNYYVNVEELVKDSEGCEAFVNW